MPGIPVEIRSIDRSELYVCDEVFLCGTGVQISAVVEVDHRAVGTGAIGPVARQISQRYFEAVRGRLPEYLDWLTPIGASRRAGRRERGEVPGDGRRQPTGSICRLGALRPASR